jgi:hypothetical protein
MKTIRFNIEGRWTTHDFSEFFRSVTHLYSLNVLIELERQDNQQLERYYMELREFSRMGPLPRRMWRTFARTGMLSDQVGEKLITASSLDRSFDFLEEHEHLRVRRCNYASPGNIDLVGIGQSVGHLKDLVTKIIDVRVQAPERNLRNEILEEERKSAALKNLREQIGILKELGYSEAEVRQIIAKSKPAIEAISGLGERGLISEVKEIDSNDG